MQLQKGEHFLIRNGRPHLCKNGTARVFANRTQADNAAERVGGTAYQGLSMRFLVIIPEGDFYAYERDLERSVAKLTIEVLLAAGYEVSMNDGEETTVERSTDAEAILAAMFTTDEDYLLPYRPGAKSGDGWVRFIYGNSPSEVINDYTTNLEAVLKPVDAYTDTLSEQGL